MTRKPKRNSNTLPAVGEPLFKCVNGATFLISIWLHFLPLDLKKSCINLDQFTSRTAWHWQKAKKKILSFPRINPLASFTRNQSKLEWRVASIFHTSCNLSCTWVHSLKQCLRLAASTQLYLFVCRANKVQRQIISSALQKWGKQFSLQQLGRKEIICARMKERERNLANSKVLVICLCKYGLLAS